MTAFDPRSQRRTILLVDDEPSILSALSRIFRARYRDAPISVETFENPADALERARAKRFDIVISDMRMPGMDGARFLQAFREIQSDAPRILLSARADFEQLSRAINDGGICRFCEKPWVDDELLDLVEQEIAKAEALAENEELANEKRVGAGQISGADVALKRLAKDHPLLATVPQAPDGSILLQWD